jgi:hypothetical protein
MKVERTMHRGSIALLFVFLMSAAGFSYAEDWDLVKNVKRLERIAPDYQDDKVIDKKFLDVLDLTEKTKKDAEIYDEAKRVAAIPALNQSKYMDSFLYYMLVKSTTLSKAGTAEPDYWLGLLKAYDKSPHILPAVLVHIKQLPKNSPDIRRDTEFLVNWIKAQKPDLKVRAPEYAGNMIMGYKPRVDFAEGDYLKLYSLANYKAAVNTPAGFQDDDTYVSLLARIMDGREDIMAEMSDIYRKMGRRVEASNVLYRLAMMKSNSKDFEGAMKLLDDAVKQNPENAVAKKERDRIKLELTYQSLAPAAPAPQPNPQEPASAPVQENIVK